MERKAWRFHPIKIVTMPSEEISASIMHKVSGDVISGVFYLNKIVRLGNRNIKIEQIVANDINSSIKLLKNGDYRAGIKSIETDDNMLYFNDKWTKVLNEVGDANFKASSFKDVQEIYGIFRENHVADNVCARSHISDWYLAFGLNNRYLAPLDKIKSFTLATYNSGL